MSLTKSTLIDDSSRNLSPVAPEYGEEMEDVYGMGDWPGEQECADDLDHE